MFVQVFETSTACQSEGDEGTDQRARCGSGYILLPWVVVTSGEDGNQNVGATKCRKRQTVQNGQEEQTEHTPMAEVGGEARAALLLRRGLNQLDEHLNIIYYSATNYRNSGTVLRREAESSFASKHNPVGNANH